jgi:hypothetical protein
MPKDARVFVFEHVSVGVESLARSVEFYDACMAALGYVRLWLHARSAGYPAGYTAEARAPRGARAEATEATS